MAGMSQKALLTAVVAGIMAMGGSAGLAQADEHGEGGKYECQGANACKGKGACGGAGHSCAGKNECKGKGWAETKDKADCDAMMAKMKEGKGKKKAKKDKESTG